MTDRARRGPLAGITVIDFTRIVAGPICSRMLADLGAEVIKVEPADGDLARTVPPFVDGTGAYFAQLNIGKRDISIDLRAPDGQRLLGELAAGADVLLENFRPGVMERNGLGPAAMLARNPRLVYCSISGWGHDNARSGDRSYAPLVHAETGTIEFSGRMRGHAEQEVHVHGDIYPGLLATSAILAALVQRSTTGAGQHLDVSMAESLVWTNEWAAADLAGYSDAHSFDTWRHPVGVLADGTGVTAVSSPRRSLARWIEALGGTSDPDVDTDEEAAAIVRQLIAAVPDFATLQARVEPAGLMVAEVRSLTEFADTGWAGERGLLREVQPGLRVPAAPFRFSGAPIGATGAPPEIGEHTAAVLAERLGLSPAEIGELAARGVIRLGE